MVKMELIRGVLFILLSILTLAEPWTDTKQRRFPDDFMFGVATSAYQIEGAWNVDGKGESIWDRYTHSYPERIANGTNGDVADNSYHLFLRDVKMLRELGVDHYRFSISWSRVLPTGFINNINENGLEYYEKLIDELIKYNIEPLVTLYHSDLPQRLQDLGGWANPLIVDWFEDYAGLVYKRFASKVKYWATINEPNHICNDGYGGAFGAPAIEMEGIANYLCIKNILVAHAKAYRLYEREYKTMYNGLVCIVLDLEWAEPINNKTENVKAAEVNREFNIGLYMNPIWSPEGDFPKIVRDVIAKKSKEQGFSKSRLPAFTAEEKIMLIGSSDFLGLNHYTTTQIAYKNQSECQSPSFQNDQCVETSQKKEWKQAKSPWLRSVPYGLYKTCIYLNQKYNYPIIFVTEHGWSTDPGLGDQSRVDNLREYLFALLLAMEDGTEVLGYTQWSLMDNIEWTAGTSQRFGIYEVDFTSEEKTRTARLSAFVYKRIIEKRIIEEDWTPENLTMQISDRRLKEKKVEL